MKTYSEFKQHLLEKLSAVVYHKTSIDGAYSILKHNEFILTSTIGREENQNAIPFENKLVSQRKGKGNFYFMSFSQSKTGAFIRQKLREGVVFTIDGDMLSHRYRGEPVDFFHDENSKKGIVAKFHHATDESEDRLITDKPSIPNAIKYIRFASFRFGHLSKNDTAIVRNMIDILKEKGIPYEVYNTMVSVSKPATESEIEQILAKGNELPGEIIPRQIPGSEPLKDIVELIEKKPGDKLSKYADMALATIMDDPTAAYYHYRDKLTNFSIPKGEGKSEGRIAHEKISEYMRVKRIPSLFELMNHLHKKYAKK